MSKLCKFRINQPNVGPTLPGDGFLETLNDELLAIYGATRQMAEGMTARDAELKQSTAALKATTAQVRQLPAMLGQQTSKYIAAGIREAVEDDFKQPLEKAIEGPIRSIDVAAYNAREAVGHLKEEARFQTDRVRPHPGSGFCSGSLRNILLLYPAGVGVEQPFRSLGATAGGASTCCRGHPRLNAAAWKEARAALIAGYGFEAHALGTRIQPASHKPTASTAGG